MVKYLRLVAALLPLVSLSAASPLPDFDLDAIAELPTPTSIPADIAFTVIDAATAVQSILATATPAAAIKNDLVEGAQEAAENSAAPTVSVTSLRKRADPKTVYPSLPAGNYLDSDQWPAGNFTTETFQSFAAYVSAANDAAVDGWTKTQTGGKSMRGDMPGVLRISTYSSYDPAAMAAKCKSITNCMSFGMWYERTPTVAPSAANPNPQPAVWVKVLFYAFPLSLAEATGDGQWSQKFWRSHTGAAFFTNSAFTPRAMAGYKPPISLPGAIQVGDAQVAANGGIDPELTRSDPMTGIPDPLVCKTLCDKYTADKSYFNGIKKNCAQFNIILLALNGKVTGWQCQYYTNVFDASVATNRGGMDSKGNRVDVVGSWVYDADPQPEPYVKDPSHPAPGMRECGLKNIEHRGSCYEKQDWSVDMDDDADTVGIRVYSSKSYSAEVVNGWKVSTSHWYFQDDPITTCFTSLFYPAGSLPGLEQDKWYMLCNYGTTWTARDFSADLISATFQQRAQITAYRDGVEVGSFTTEKADDVRFPADWTGITSISMSENDVFTDFKMIRHYGA
ncbi:uncharacterized protein PFL1_02643 [Pseudozyma flocculosa PF-1]|uniref:Uncharacterized protein n=2 Tax=Pseudozyma flocculosa TaxID=84751 RepID=A0A5C3EZQ3_9BASI|nr:uncharacterized protein PFL1_02643 [Pseudozyma flocculosa PF-1]EPQ29970.1 hypothetical protein PFL1_02643 [Pseudozyma flocculosa PF-1]SPO37285.1 uncharacterized protein PSFLO_02758 [Pseudozyma flocculosa]